MLATFPLPLIEDLEPPLPNEQRGLVHGGARLQMDLKRELELMLELHSR